MVYSETILIWVTVSGTWLYGRQVCKLSWEWVRALEIFNLRFMSFTKLKFSILFNNFLFQLTFELFLILSTSSPVCSLARVSGQSSCYSSSLPEESIPPPAALPCLQAGTVPCSPPSRDSDKTAPCRRTSVLGVGWKLESHWENGALNELILSPAPSKSEKT